MNERPRSSSPAILEIAVAVHVTVFVIGASWAFGGNADWVRTPISIWGSVGILLTIFGLARNRQEGIPSWTPSWAWPVVVLNVIVGVSCLTPGFRFVPFEKESLMMPVRVDWWIPSAARYDLALRALWLFDGIYFSCLNITLIVSRRKTIRIVLGAAIANAVALSVFGTVQKLVGATGIYFGAIKSPQDYFFASFVYDNHWGAFIVLIMGACVGLTLRYAHGTRGKGFFHGPAPAGIVAAALLSISVPYSGSRACTVLLGILAVVALIHGVPRISRALSASGITPKGAFFGMAAAAILAIAGVWTVAGDVIEARASKTKEQVASMWAHGGIGSRSILYHDTWRMARERILFGWGMGSYPVVFGLYNTQESKVDRLPVIYHDAHSDWLQSIAEIGIAGTFLIGASIGLPVFAVRRSKLATLPYFLFSGCVLTGAYAWIEFPFGNVAVVLVWWLSFFGAIQYMRLIGHPDGIRQGT